MSERECVVEMVERIGMLATARELGLAQATVGRIALGAGSSKGSLAVVREKMKETKR